MPFRLLLALLIASPLTAQELVTPSAPALTTAPAPFPQATLVVHAPAGKQPTTCAIADDGRTLLVTNRGDNTLSVFETAGMTVTRTVAEVGYSAWGVLPTSGDLVLVANWAGSSLAVLNRGTGKRLGEIPVGMKPSYLALSPDGKRAYSAGNFSEDVTIADVASRKGVRTVPVGSRPMGVALSADGTRLYVAACGSKKIAVVDAAAGTVLASHPAPLASTTNLVRAPDGRLLAAGEGGRLLVMDPATGAISELVAGGDSSSVAVTPDGRVALVADYGGASVSLVDLGAMRKVAAVPVGEGAIHVETDGRRFYTCNDKAGTVSAYRLDVPEAASAP